MSEIPKFALSRLSRPAPESHPDPDVLTAFVERALSDRERTQVLDHLAACGDCRDVVALARPEAVEQAQKGFVPGKRGLLRWPVLRWVAAAACLAVAGSIALQLRRPSQEPVQFSTAKRTNVPPSAVVAGEPAAAREEAKAGLSADQPASAPLHERQAAVSAPSAAGTLARRAAPAEEGKTAALDQKAHYGGYSQQIVPKPPGTLTAKAGNADQGRRSDYDKNSGFQGYSNVMANPPGGAAGNQVAAPPQAEPAQGVVAAGRLAEADSRSKELAKAKSEATGKKTDNLVSSLPEGREYSVSGPKDNLKAPSSAGATAVAAAPAKSLATPPAAPQGATETVEVTAASPSVQAETTSTSVLQKTAMLRAPAILPRWRLTQDRQLERASVADSKWQLVPLEGQPQLHALFFSGPNVWVGGKGGFLLHSADAGEHWQRVTPAHDGVALADDIVAIDFQDFQHGQLKTGKKAVWITSDGGRTWAPQ